MAFRWFFVTIVIVGSLLLEGCAESKPEIIRYDFETLGNFQYQIDLNYSVDLEDEVVTVTLDNHLGIKGERNCFWGGDSSIQICALDIGSWRPWGRELWLLLSTGLSHGDLLLLGRVSNNRANGIITLSNSDSENIGTFEIEFLKN